MKWLITLLVSCSLALPFGSAFADQTTAPGQEKKEDGAQSAKDYAPGHEDDSEAGKAKSEAESKADKAKADAKQATPDVGAAKAKGVPKAPGNKAKNK